MFSGLGSGRKGRLTPKIPGRRLGRCPAAAYQKTRDVKRLVHGYKQANYYMAMRGGMLASQQGAFQTAVHIIIGLDGLR